MKGNLQGAQRRCVKGSASTHTQPHTQTPCTHAHTHTSVAVYTMVELPKDTDHHHHHHDPCHRHHHHYDRRRRYQRYQCGCQNQTKSRTKLSCEFDLLTPHQNIRPSGRNLRTHMAKCPYHSDQNYGPPCLIRVPSTVNFTILFPKFNKPFLRN